MAKLKQLPAPITILIIVILIAAAATWLLPAGEYDKLAFTAPASFSLNTQKGIKTLPFNQHTLDSLKVRIPLSKFSSGDIRKPVAVPGTYHRLDKNSQGAIEIVQAPIKGIYDTVDIIFLILFIGGFMAVFQATGAMEKGIRYLSYKMNGREAWLIITIGFFFCFCGSSYGMGEEALVFYPVLVPLFLAAGYDLLVPLAVIFAAPQVGCLSSFSNPFATIIASNAAGINWSDGLYERIGIFVVTSIAAIWYIVRYAERVRKNPELSLVKRLDGHVVSPYPGIPVHNGESIRLGSRNILILLLFFATLAGMICGVVFLHWWMLELTALYPVSAILMGLLVKMKERIFVERFVEGSKTLMGVALIIGVARGITIVLNEGHISDYILFYSSGLVSGMPPVIFIVVLFIMFNVFSLFISSSSGMAVLTMPIFGSLAVVVGVPGREIVNSYIYGMGVMQLIAPNGLILPSLALANVSLKTWWRFCWPLMLILSAISIVFLIAGVLCGK
jgi:uncharacterized ion transporter superfamily protein YfcC